MIKFITAVTVFALGTLPGAYAQQNKAPCGSFQKGTDNSWTVIAPVKIETDKGSGMLSPGTIIKPGKQIAGVDIYLALQRSCH